MKILLVGPSWVGDMVMAQCLLKALKARGDEVTIDVLAPDWTFALLNRMPEVRRAIPMPVGHGAFGLRARYQIGKQLRSEQYDQAVVLPNSWKSALIPFFARIPKRTGWLGECRYGLLNDARKLNKQQYPLMIERFLALAYAPETDLPKPYPTPSFQIKPEDQAAALDHIFGVRSGVRSGVKSEGQNPILALAPGAAFGPSKQWPADYFAELANRKIAEGYDVWLFGSPKDIEATDRVMTLTEQRCVNIAGRTQLHQTIDLLSLVEGVVANDSGLLHVAAALGKPLVGIYGSTSPDFTPPLSDKAVILKLNLDCQPCFQRECPLKHHKCMRDLTPEMVLSAMWERS